MNRDKLISRLIDAVENRYFGKYRAFLVDNQDPLKLGRLRLLIPSVLGEEVSGWAMPCAIYGGGPDLGAFRIPPVTRDANSAYTTGIWVEFEGGDIEYPVWVGTFWGAPGGTPEPPGDDAAPDVDVHVQRTFAGHSTVAVDTPGAERLEVRDASGQRLTFSCPLKAEVKRDGDGQKVTETVDVAYGDLAEASATVELMDFAGNALLLDGTQAAPTVRITNTDRDGAVLQTIELYGGSEAPKITITDNNGNVVTLDPEGIHIEAKDGTSTQHMTASGITEDAPEINLNSGTKGAARLDDKVRSTQAEDPRFWAWMKALDIWVKTHSHGGPPPVTPLPMPFPTECVGKIIESSDTVIIGD